MCVCVCWSVSQEAGNESAKAELWRPPTPLCLTVQHRHVSNLNAVAIISYLIIVSNFTDSLGDITDDVMSIVSGEILCSVSCSQIITKPSNDQTHYFWVALPSGCP